MIKLLIIPALLTMLVLQCGSFSAPPKAKTTSTEFMQMLAAGDVEKYEVINNQKTVNVYLKAKGQEKYAGRLKEVKATKNGPHMKLKYAGDFNDQVEMYYKASNTSLEKKIPYTEITETDW